MVAGSSEKNLANASGSLLSEPRHGEGAAFPRVQYIRVSGGTRNGKWLLLTQDFSESRVG